MYSKWHGICGLLTLTASLAMLGCGSTNNSNVRAVNASPGLSNFTVLVGNIGVASSLPYGTEGVQPKGQYSVNDTSGNYRLVAAGNNQGVSVFSTPGTTLTSSTQNLASKGYYTIVSLSPAPSIHLQTLTDDDSAPQSGSYKLRVMSASQASGALDMYITAAGGSVVGATPTVGNINFQQVTSYLQLSPGPLEIQITPHGNPSNVLATAPFSSTGGNIYSVFLMDPNIGSPNYVILIVNDPVATGTATMTPAP